MALTQREQWPTVAASAKQLSGPGQVTVAPTDVIALARVRDGAEYLPAFVEYYTRLGVRHIYLLDNLSEDDTVQLAAQYDQVTVFQTALPYKEYKMAFLHFLLHRFGLSCWSLVVDIDEFFDYPLSDVIALPQLIQYLEHYNYQAVVGQMLDRYPERFSPHQPQDFLGDHRCYTLQGLQYLTSHEAIRRNEWSNHNICVHQGGARDHWLGLPGTDLTKFPLMRFSADWPWESIHRLYPCRVADFSTVLHHFKFRSDLQEFVDKAVVEGQYNRDSRAYKKMQTAMREGDMLHRLPPGTQYDPSPYDLVGAGFLEVSAPFLRWTHERSDVAATSKVLDMAIDWAARSSQQVSDVRRDSQEEMDQRLRQLQATTTWRLGRAIIGPLDRLLRLIGVTKKE